MPTARRPVSYASRPLGAHEHATAPGAASVPMLVALLALRDPRGEGAKGPPGLRLRSHLDPLPSWGFIAVWVLFSVWRRQQLPFRAGCFWA